MSDKVLEVRDLNVWYRPSGTIRRSKMVQVLHDVSFDLYRGEILGVVGESGSGKSTLAKTILGMVPDYTGTYTHYTKRPQMVFRIPPPVSTPAAPWAGSWKSPCASTENMTRLSACAA